MSLSPHRVLIVGAGLTGSITACQLKRLFKHNVSITVWEKSRGTGGRMNTSRCSVNPKLSCDLGAQYVSATPVYYEKHERFYDELLKAGVIKPFTGSFQGEVRHQPGTKHYVAPLGINTIAKHFLSNSDSRVMYETFCEEINLEKKGNSWKVYSKNKDHCFNADTIIITIPVPQLLQLKGVCQELMETCRTDLEKVRYSSRYALAMYFNKTEEDIAIPYTCMYVKENECVRFLSFDTAKRERDSLEGTSLLVHTSVPFGIKHLEEDMNIVEPLIIDQVKSLLPDLPKPSSTKCIRWRYSQVSESYSGSPGCIILNQTPLLIAGGDGFTHSNFDGCIDSALSIVEKFNTVVGITREV